MSNITKESILDAIRRTAEQNDGKPLAVARFEVETAINPYDWGKYWARFGDAQKEAGFIPNQLQAAHADEFIIGKAIELIRKLGRFPTSRDIEVERNTNPELPSKKVFQRLGTKELLVQRVVEFCKSKTGFDDVVEVCESLLKVASKKSSGVGSSVSDVVGEVYLFKSGRYYKIGRTSNTVRRGSELRIQFPEKMDLIHSIKTDDPSGVEAYWHKRFDAKRMNGEWFDLNSVEIKAFKRWRRII